MTHAEELPSDPTKRILQEMRDSLSGVSRQDASVATPPCLVCGATESSMPPYWTDCSYDLDGVTHKIAWSCYGCYERLMRGDWAWLRSNRILYPSAGHSSPGESER